MKRIVVLIVFLILIGAIIVFLPWLMAQERQAGIELSLLQRDAIRLIAAVMEESGYDEMPPRLGDLIATYNEEFSKNTPISAAKQQPYEAYGIYVLEVKKCGVTLPFLYGRVELLESTMQDYTPEENSSVIYVAQLGYWDESRKEYISCPLELSDRSKHLNSWYYIGLRNFGLQNSKLPLLPGCIVTADGYESSNADIYYPRKLLPVVKAIYPNIEIPEDGIIETLKPKVATKISEAAAAGF